jgi:hypothetical protein
VVSWPGRESCAPSGFAVHHIGAYGQGCPTRYRGRRAIRGATTNNTMPRYNTTEGTAKYRIVSHTLTGEDDSRRTTACRRRALVDLGKVKLRPLGSPRSVSASPAGRLPTARATPSPRSVIGLTYMRHFTKKDSSVLLHTATRLGCSAAGTRPSARILSGPGQVTTDPGNRRPHRCESDIERQVASPDHVRWDSDQMAPDEVEVGSLNRVRRAAGCPSGMNSVSGIGMRPGQGAGVALGTLCQRRTGGAQKHRRVWGTGGEAS